MTPGARLSAAIDILNIVDSDKTAADALIRAYFRSRRYAGSKDRRAVTDRVFFVLRHRARLDWWIAGAAGDMAPDGRTRVLASLLLDDQETAAGIATLFNGEGHNPVPLSPEETALAENLAGKGMEHDAMPEAVILEVPAWLEEPLRSQWKERFTGEMVALNATAPVDVRVNLSRVSRDQAMKSLSREDIATHATNLSPAGLRLDGRVRLEQTKAFKKGLVEVQDEGSQLVAQLCDVKPGMTVVDYCAGAGGKTLALADRMGLQDAQGEDSALIACDISEKRLARMDDRLKRAGLERAVHRQSLSGEGSEWVGLNEGIADRVLIDAPCSGTGAWRRHPETRWRLSQSRLDTHMSEQDDVLQAAARLVAPGGWLIYATCSFLKCENEDRIAAFLAKHEQFSALRIADVWAASLGGPCPTTGTALTLTPATTSTDGFYCTVLARRAG